MSQPVPVEYHLLQRAGKPGLWRPIVGSVTILFVTFLSAPVLIQIPIAAWFVATGRDLASSFDTLTDLDNPTPSGLAYLNIVLAAAIPVTFAYAWFLHGMKPRWLTSVRPRMRWRFFAVCLVLALVALTAALVVGVLTPEGSTSDGTEVSGELNAWTSTTRDFVLVVLLLTPFQAAGEEYLFRGYLTQAFGGLFRSRIAAVVIPSLLFALAHGVGQSLPVFFDRLAFGLVAGTLVVLTGGLEAGIAMHVLNNWVAFGLALAFGNMGDTLNATGGSWWMMASTLAQSLVYLGLVYGAARILGLVNTGSPLVLEAQRGRV